jgi:hypothetical protein
MITADMIRKVEDSIDALKASAHSLGGAEVAKEGSAATLVAAKNDDDSKQSDLDSAEADLTAKEADLEAALDELKAAF